MKLASAFSRFFSFSLFSSVAFSSAAGPGKTRGMSVISTTSSMPFYWGQETLKEARRLSPDDASANSWTGLFRGYLALYDRVKEEA